MVLKLWEVYMPVQKGMSLNVDQIIPVSSKDLIAYSISSRFENSTIPFERDILEIIIRNFKANESHR